MKKLFRCTILLLALILFVVPAAALAAGADQTLVILHTNDFHGHPLKFNYQGIPDVGGLPAIATFVNQVRARHKNVLLLDAGDLNTGRAESNLFKAVPDIVGFNYLGYDAMTLGNHEFDNPLAILRNQERLARFPFLSANIRSANADLLVRPYVVKRFDGFKVGILGLTLKETKGIGYPDHVKDLVFEDEVKAARRLVKVLKNKADIVIALVHLGIWDHETRGSKRLAAKVQGIDLIIDGHTHTDLTEPVYVNGTPIVQAFQWGLKIGKAIMTVRDGRVAGFRWESVPINLKEKIKLPDGTESLRYLGERYDEDPFLLSALTPYSDKVESLLSEVIGTAEADFGNENVRKQETELGNLVADSMLWYTRNLHTDFALQNGGGIRVGLPAGEITKKRIYETLPFDNTVVVLKLKGRQVLRLFDYMASISGGAGGFPQVSEGVRLAINSAARKIEGVTINGRPIDPDRIYAMATNSYLAGGGDGYKILPEALDLYDTSAFQRDALIEYIATVKKSLKPELEGRIQITKTWNRDELVNPHDIGTVAPANENVGSATVPTWQAGSPALRALGQRAFSILPIGDSLPEILISSHLCCQVLENPAN
jgi:5'-nucleotidase/UDP-sugar diphosphatase